MGHSIRRVTVWPSPRLYGEDEPPSLLSEPWTPPVNGSPSGVAVYVSVDRITTEGLATVGYGSYRDALGYRRPIRFRAIPTVTPAYQWVHPRDVLEDERLTAAELLKGF